MLLSRLEKEEKAIVTRVLGSGNIRKRILEMGFIVGREIKVVNKAPFKDPIEIQLMGSNVMLRKKEAEIIEVEKKKATTGNRTHHPFPRVFL